MERLPCSLFAFAFATCRAPGERIATRLGVTLAAHEERPFAAVQAYLLATEAVARGRRSAAAAA